MKVLSRQEAKRWCSSHRIALSGGAPDLSDINLRFAIPSDAGRRVWLAQSAMSAFAGERAVLVWVTGWSAWPSGERMHVFDRFRLSYDETRPLIDAPAHLFDGAEIEDAVSLVTIAVLFLWDCFVVTPNRAKLLHFSHDEFGAVAGHGFPREELRALRRER